MEDKKVLLSIKDLQVKFRVRGRILTAIRGVTLDIYENESIAIVGESGAGKSVFTKAFAGMLDSNGFIDQGDIIFNDAELSDTVVPLSSYAKKTIASTWEKLNDYSKLEYGSEVFLKMKDLEQEKEEKMTLSEEEREKADAEIKELVVKRTELFNYKQTLDTSKEKAKVKETSAEISRLDGEIKALQKAKEEKIKAHKQAAMNDTAYNQAYDAKMAEYKKEYAGLTAKEITDETKKRNEILAKEIYLSVGRYKLRKKVRMIKKLHEAFKAAMERGVDLNDEQKRNGVFDQATFRVRYLDETPEQLHGTCIINLAKIQDPNDWGQIRGKKIATVFQDPMTSLNPIITIGKQITSVIMKHQNVSEVEARAQALELMEKVGVDIVLSSRLLSAGEVLRFVRKGGIVSVSLLEGAQAEALEIIVGENSDVDGVAVRDMNLPPECLLCAIVRGNEAYIPNGNTVLHANDRVILFIKSEFSKTTVPLFEGRGA